MLDYIEKNADDADANACMEKFYSKTLESFQNTNNERLWLKTNTKLARLWLDQKDYRRLTEKLRELHKACQTEDGSDDATKGTYLLEIYALEILMYAETRNNKRLKVRTCVCVPACVYLCVCVCMCICICVCVCVCGHVWVRILVEPYIRRVTCKSLGDLLVDNSVFVASLGARADMRPSGPLSAGPQGQICCSTSKNHGHHP